MRKINKRRVAERERMRDRKIVNLMLNKLHQRIIPQCAAMQFALGMGNKEQAIPRMGE